MVDPTKGLGSIQGFTPGGKSAPAPAETRRNEKKEQAAAKDEVQISAEALSLQEAEQAARETKEALAKNGFSLGLDPNFTSIKA